MGPKTFCWEGEKRWKKKEWKEEDKEERWKRGSVDGGGQGDKVNYRVFALEEAGIQRERGRGGSKQDFERERCWRGEKKKKKKRRRKKLGRDGLESRRGAAKGRQQWRWETWRRLVNTHTHKNTHTNSHTTRRVKVFCINMVRIMKTLAGSF